MWMGDWIAGRPSFAMTDWARFAGAGLLTLLSVFIVAILWRRLGILPDPGLLLLLTVALSSYLAGGMAGMLSAAIVLFCSFVLFSHPLYLFRYSELDWRQLMAIVIACPLIALMVGSLKEQVDRLQVATGEADLLKDEIRRFEATKDALHVCEQRFQLLTAHTVEYAACALDASGMVMHWNAGAERLFGYPNSEIAGQNYSRFFTKEDILARRPERLLEVARFTGRSEEEGWRIRKGGLRFRTSTVVLPLKAATGSTVGYLVIARDLTMRDETKEALAAARAELESLKSGQGPRA
jgi:PAS domain S-box-containing protein